MAYQSWSVVFGEQPSAAKWNILGTNDSSFNDGTGIANLEIGSGHTSLKLDYKFRAVQTSAQSLAPGYNLGVFDTKVYDTGSNYSTATNLFTAPVAGLYTFKSNVKFAAVGSSAVALAFLKNGANYSNVGNIAEPGSGFPSTFHADDIMLAAGDTVGSYPSNGAGGARNTQVDYSGMIFFAGRLISQT